MRQNEGTLQKQNYRRHKTKTSVLTFPRVTDSIYFRTFFNSDGNSSWDSSTTSSTEMLYLTSNFSFTFCRNKDKNNFTFCLSFSCFFVVFSFSLIFYRRESYPSYSLQYTGRVIHYKTSSAACDLCPRHHQGRKPRPPSTLSNMYPSSQLWRLVSGHPKIRSYGDTSRRSLSAKELIPHDQ